jgi:hypothetical protein
MWRVFGIATPLPVALHTVASQHISTLHNTPGTHILRYVPAQVKHHLCADRFFALHARHIAASTRGHNNVVASRIASRQHRIVAHTHAAPKRRVPCVALLGARAIWRAHGACTRTDDPPI